MRILPNSLLGAILIFGHLLPLQNACAQNAINMETNRVDAMDPDAPIFDDDRLLNGYAERYSREPLDTILAMIQDETLDSYKMAAAVRVFKDRFVNEVFPPEKYVIEKNLIRRLNRTDSPFVQVEIMETLCRMDRYKYFKVMVPLLIQKLDHYNDTVNMMAYTSLEYLTGIGRGRASEARFVFNYVRRSLLLSRKRLSAVAEPDDRLKQKLKLLRWSIKILGTQELNRLPKEVINLL